MISRLNKQNDERLGIKAKRDQYLIDIRKEKNAELIRSKRLKMTAALDQQEQSTMPEIASSPERIDEEAPISKVDKYYILRS